MRGSTDAIHSTQPLPGAWCEVETVEDDSWHLSFGPTIVRQWMQMGLRQSHSISTLYPTCAAAQVLSKDLRTVRELVEDVVAQLGASAGGASLSGAKVGWPSAGHLCAGLDRALEEGVGCEGGRMLSAEC